MFQQYLLCRTRLGGARFQMFVGTIALQLPGLSIIGQITEQAVFEHGIAGSFFFDGKAYFDAKMQIAGHPVGAGAEHQGVAIVMKIIDARVLQETTHDRSYRDVVRYAFNAGAQATDAPNDQIDLDLCL